MGAEMRGELWAVCAYFNPAGYECRWANFEIFRRHLSVPLLVAEAGVRGRFDLGPGDADRMIRIVAQDPLWHKESLIQIAIRHLPDACTHVAWLDADVIFERDDWPAAAIQLLETEPMAQLYDRVNHMPEGWIPDIRPSTKPDFSQTGVGALVRLGNAPAQVMDGVLGRGPSSAAVGFGWAARRELLERTGFYRYAVAGGGDTATACAALGCPEVCCRRHFHSARQEQVYRQWADRLFRETAGRIGVLEGAILHLWHGTMADRRAQERHRLLHELGFDPHADLEESEGGLLQWRHGRERMRDAVKRYFEDRNEDGRPRREVVAP